MTILSSEKVLQQPRALLWRMASQFEQAPQWFEGVKKTECVSGQVANLGGVWRANLYWGGLQQIIDFEITEWLEGERFGLRPLNVSVVEDDTELYQIVFNFKGLADSQTQVTVQCDYEPRHRLAKIKNLMFLRLRYLRRLESSLAALERVAGEQPVSS
ncbi:MAG: SRPBCC family protein [bacterium]